VKNPIQFLALRETPKTLLITYSTRWLHFDWRLQAAPPPVAGPGGKSVVKNWHTLLTAQNPDIG
jgi:hypothetical protein